MIRPGILKKVLIIIFQLSVLYFLSCGLHAQSNWTKFEYYFNVGSLPPPYHYSYTITLSTDGAGELVYTKGYTYDDKNTSRYSFELSKEKLKNLKNAVKESDVLNLDIETLPNEEIPDGGHSDELKIYGVENDGVSGDVILLKTVPMYPELKYETILNTLYKVIENSVPDDIWKEVNSKRDN
ncbi:MAG TPA: hypothetical protein VIK14_17585 [Ignavibacteria bacterium]